MAFADTPAGADASAALYRFERYSLMSQGFEVQEQLIYTLNNEFDFVNEGGLACVCNFIEKLSALSTGLLPLATSLCL